MGAELVGYMFVGPICIPDEALAAARQMVRERWQDIQTLLHLEQQDETAMAIAEKLGVSHSKEDFLEERPWLQELLLRWDDVADLPYATMAVEQVEQIVDTFADLWHERTYARDSCWRVVTVQDRPVKILFAGDQTWGDSPDGLAYRMLTHITDLDLAETLLLE